jgi:hypothetical protein
MTPRLDPDRLTRAVLWVAAAVGILLPSIVGLLVSGNLVLAGLTGPNAALHRTGALAAGLALAALVAAVRLLPARMGHRAFLIVATAVALAVKLAWVHLVTMEPLSDFGKMWALASEVAAEGPGTATGSPLFMKRVFFERILPFFLPMRLLFGPEPSSYAVPNVLAGIATSWLVYLLAREWFGAGAARAAFVLSLAAPEALLAAEIPTHDIPGALYTVAGLVVFNAACKLFQAGRTRAALAAGCAFGLVAVIVGLQRTTGPFLLLSCGLLGVAVAVVGGEAGRRRRIAGLAGLAALVLLIAPLAVYQAGRGALRLAGVTLPQEMLVRQRGMVMTASSESWSDGSWWHFETEYRRRYGHLESVDWPRLGMVRFATDTYHTPTARLSHYLRKASFLYDLGGLAFFYVRGADLAGVGPIEGWREERLTLLCRCFTVFFLACLLVGCHRLWNLPRVPLRAFVPLFYFAVLASLLLFFAQTQSRYLYQIWYIGSIYAGIALAGLRSSAMGEQDADG